MTDSLHVPPGSEQVHDVNDYRVLHTMKYTAPVLSVAVSVRLAACVTQQRCGAHTARAVQPNDTHLVVGMANGLLSIKRRAAKTAETAVPSDETRRRRHGTFRFFVRGKSHKPDDVCTRLLPCPCVD